MVGGGITMGTGRPIPALILNQEERETLERWARRPRTAQALAQRARIILGYSSGKTNSHVAERMHITKQCVGKWRSRFLAKRLDGLSIKRVLVRRVLLPMLR